MPNLIRCPDCSHQVSSHAEIAGIASGVSSARGPIATEAGGAAVSSGLRSRVATAATQI